MASRKKTTKKCAAKKTTRKAGNVFAIASKDKTYRAAKKRANAAVKKAASAYKAAIKKAKFKRK